MTTDETSLESSSVSARQLRREAEKARGLAAKTYHEEDRKRFNAIAATLEREADEIDRVLARPHQEGRDRPPGWMVAPAFRDS